MTHVKLHKMTNCPERLKKKMWKKNHDKERMWMFSHCCCGSTKTDVETQKDVETNHIELLTKI